MRESQNVAGTLLESIPGSLLESAEAEQDLHAVATAADETKQALLTFPWVSERGPDECSPRISCTIRAVKDLSRSEGNRGEQGVITHAYTPLFLLLDGCLKNRDKSNTNV